MILGGQTDDFRVDRQVTLGDEQMTLGETDMQHEKLALGDIRRKR